MNQRRISNRLAFSLLELLIVLAIMVALAAVAWPSLRRPMADSTVHQAAAALRDQISSCRQAAAMHGQPRLMRFESGQSSVRWGTWTDLIAEQLRDASSLEASPLDASTLSAANNGEESLDDASVTGGLWELPIDVVIDDVQLDTQTYETPESLPLTGLSEAVTQASEDESFEWGDAAQSTDPLDENPTSWYLPFLPNGQTRDAVIVLRDVVSGSRVALEIDAVTGMMRTSRMSSIEPDPATDFASAPPSDFSAEDVSSSADASDLIDWEPSE
ncbi:pilus assembly FimT family protein [Novipirellula artificiosorum]|uniref:Type II secretion system protein H n=1 Tax=Novipirellula artificiosorum TaxID=2528016 RepID=A0A5C6DUN5_9BACT|nr:prepilin-type N-terminal cleavage/methylation domain-containing protein [Novipirellula artificiosorum]TWU38479.1 hypothetical protein Poly41_29550 [Novipirellula artificiosorum]